jgi:hypothetical protein
MHPMLLDTLTHIPVSWAYLYSVKYVLPFLSTKITVDPTVQKLAKLFLTNIEAMNLSLNLEYPVAGKVSQLDFWSFLRRPSSSLVKRWAF